MRLDAAVSGGAEAAAGGFASVIVGALPLMEHLGVTTAAEVQSDTLADRLLGDVLALDGIVIAPPLVGAWARTPA